MMLEQLVPFNRSARTDHAAPGCHRGRARIRRAPRAARSTPRSPRARCRSRCRPQSAAALAEDLLTELAYSYKLLLVEQSRRLFGFASSGRALLPVVRAMQMLARAPQARLPDVRDQSEVRVARSCTSSTSSRCAAGSPAAPLDGRRRDAALGLPQRAAARLRRAAQAHAGRPRPRARLARAFRPPREHRRRRPAEERPGPVPDQVPARRARLCAVEAPSSAAAGARPAAQHAAARRAPSRPDGPPVRRRDAGMRSGLTADSADRRFPRPHGPPREALGCGAEPPLHPPADACARRDLRRHPRHLGVPQLAWRHPHGDGRVDGHQRKPARLRADAREGLDRVDPRRRGDRPAHPRQPAPVTSASCAGCSRTTPSISSSASRSSRRPRAPVSIRKTRGTSQDDRSTSCCCPRCRRSIRRRRSSRRSFPLDTTCELSLGDLQSKLRVRATRLLERTVSVQLVQFSAVS